MADFLVFTLAAPVAAMGEIAVGERRSSWSRPGRSAVLGLVAAALGLDRTDQPAHDALEAGYGLAIWTEESGRPLGDYHTAQAPTAVAVRRLAKALDRPPATRREELAAQDIETILSRRDYRTDGLWFAAIWAREGARWSLETLADALRKPLFAPYFGRRSCPFGLPLAPATVSADGIIRAFRTYSEQEVDRHSLLTALIAAERRNRTGVLAAELACERNTPGAPAADRIVRRRDQPNHRVHRLFSERDEFVATLEPLLPDGANARGHR